MGNILILSLDDVLSQEQKHKSICFRLALIVRLLSFLNFFIPVE